MLNKIIALALLIIACSSYGAGFDYRYQAYVGDLNGDGNGDLFVTREKDVVLLHGDVTIPILIQPPVLEFVLQQTSNGLFDIISTLSPSQRGSVSQWSPAEVDLFFRDINADGSVDLEIGDISKVIPEALDQIVFSDPASQAAPYGVIPITQKYKRYFGDITAWLLDENYFEDNAPLVVSGVEPASRIYYGSVWNFSAATNPSGFVNRFLQQCEEAESSNLCSVSYQDPVNCFRNVPIYNEYGEYLGEENRNVCLADFHVFVYIPGTVEFRKDYSVFDEDALETKEVLVRINEGCPAIPDPIDVNMLKNPLDQMLEDLWDVFPADTDNSFNHAPFPGDSLFDTSDPSYHHYDVYTKICDVSEPSCSHAILADTVLRYFSYPSRKLQPTWTPVNGDEIDIYLPYFPSETDDPDAYIFRGGIITQRFVQASPWAGSLQNITTPTHVVYPGTIARTVISQKDGNYVLTHGVGTNRAFCSLAREFRAINVLLGYANDTAGAKAFKQVDKEMRKYWRENFSW